MGFSYIDLYLIHWPGVQKMKHDDPRNPILRQESWSDLEKLVNEGKGHDASLSTFRLRVCEISCVNADVQNIYTHF